MKNFNIIIMAIIMAITITTSPVIAGEKIEVCHKGKTISVSENSVNAHLAHGDILGDCDQLECDDVRETEEKFQASINADVPADAVRVNKFSAGLIPYTSKSTNPAYKAGVVTIQLNFTISAEEAVDLGDLGDLVGMTHTRIEFTNELTGYVNSVEFIPELERVERWEQFVQLVK